MEALQEEFKKNNIENSKLEHNKYTLLHNYEEEISFNEQFRSEYKQLESAHENINNSYQILMIEKNLLE